MRLAILVLALLAVSVSDAPAAWPPPVDGPVSRGFDVGPDPFEAGRHRGVDLTAPPGAPVRAPCGGPVVVAGRVGTSGRLVTLLCGPWRVTHMPLAAIAVRRGEDVSRGDLLGTASVSRAHAGLHLGVRRDGVRFGYVDPLRFLGAPHSAPPLALGRRGPRRRVLRPPPTARGPAPARPAVRAPTADSNPVIAAPGSNPVIAAPGSNPVAGLPASSESAPGGGVAPWPAWAGLALVLAGAGARWRLVPRRRGIHAVRRLQAGGRGRKAAAATKLDP
jgi:hypothetical protein